MGIRMLREGGGGLGGKELSIGPYFDKNTDTYTRIRASANKRAKNDLILKDYEFYNGSLKVSFSFSSRQIAFKDIMFQAQPTNNSLAKQEYFYLYTDEKV